MQTLYSIGEAREKVQTETGIDLSDAEMRSLAKLRGVPLTGGRFVVDEETLDEICDELTEAAADAEEGSDDDSDECAACGAEIAEGETACADCGAEVDEDDDEPEGEE